MADSEENKQLQLIVNEGRRQIVFKRSALKGKVTSSEVLNTILIAAQLQAEKYIEKLARNSPLDTAEIKALKELAEITKIALPEKIETLGQQAPENVEVLKQALYKKLTEKLS